MKKYPSKEDLENIKSETSRFDMIYEEYQRLTSNPIGIDFKSFHDVCYLVGLPNIKACETSADFIKVAKKTGCSVEMTILCPDCGEYMTEKPGSFECNNPRCFVLKVSKETKAVVRAAAL